MLVAVVVVLQPYLALLHQALVATVVGVAEQIHLVVILVTQGLPI